MGEFILRIAVADKGGNTGFAAGTILAVHPMSEINSFGGGDACSFLLLRIMTSKYTLETMKSWVKMKRFDLTDITQPVELSKRVEQKVQIDAYNRSKILGVPVTKVPELTTLPRFDTAFDIDSVALHDTEIRCQPSMISHASDDEIREVEKSRIHS